MREAMKANDVVINAYPTSAGKTRASYLYLLDNPNINVLLVAPTNALLSQHREDIEDFIKENKLPHIPIEVNASLLRELKREMNLPFHSISNAAVLASLIRMPYEFKSIRDKYGFKEERPIVLVVNPDIFYYSLYFKYDPSGKDARNLFIEFIKRFNYVIVDEMHYYNGKQVGNFLMFLILSKYFGYFDNGERKISILSATPEEGLTKFIDRLDLKYEIDALSEQERRDIQILTDAEVEIEKGDAVENIKGKMDRLKEYFESDKDIVIILNSLYGITKLYGEFCKQFGRENVGRITGPEDIRSRKEAIHKRIILATPTVDIGFNFSKNKDRQNVDVLIFDASTADQLIQRIGRAGRVLGKTVKDVPSKIYAMLPRSAYDRFSEMDSREIERLRFNDFVNEVMPKKTILEEYLKTYGLYESFYPIHRLRNLFPKDERKRIQKEIYEKIIECFAPSSEITFNKVKATCEAYDRRRRLVEEYNSGKRLNKYFTEKIKREFVPFIKDLYFKKGRYDEVKDIKKEDAERKLEKFLNSNPKKILKEIMPFVEDGIVRMSPLFKFRGDSSVNISAAIYDPYLVFHSGSKILTMDAIYVVSKCEFESFLDRKEFIKESGEFPGEEAIMYLKVKRVSERPYHIKFRINFPDNYEYFDRIHNERLSLLTDLQVIFSKDFKEEPIAEINKNVRSRKIVAYVFKQEHYVYYREDERTYNLRSYNLEVNCSDIKDLKYRVYFNIDAIFVDSIRIMRIEDWKRRKEEHAFQFGIEDDQN